MLCVLFLVSNHVNYNTFDISHSIRRVAQFDIGQGLVRSFIYNIGLIIPVPWLYAHKLTLVILLVWQRDNHENVEKFTFGVYFETTFIFGARTGDLD